MSPFFPGLVYLGLRHEFGKSFLAVPPSHEREGVTATTTLGFESTIRIYLEGGNSFNCLCF